jgi:hypothetical protein
MPDLDRLPRGLRRAWRSVADAVRGEQPPPVVGDAMEKAIAQTLRHSGGLTWLPDLARAVASCQADNSSDDLEAATAKLDRRVATGIGGAFVDAAWSMAGEAGSAETDAVVDELAARGIRRMIDKLCIGPIEPDLVPSVFQSSAVLREYIELCVAEVRLYDLSQKLTRTGCSGHVRAPRTRLARPGTEGLLHEPIA